MAKYRIIKGPDYGVLAQNPQMKEYVDALIGRSFNDLGKLTDNLISNLGVRGEDITFLEEGSTDEISIYYFEDKQVAKIKANRETFSEFY